MILPLSRSRSSDNRVDMAQRRYASGLTLHPLLAGGSELFYAPVAKGGVSRDHSIGGDVGNLRRIGVRSVNVLEHSIRVKKTGVSTEPLEVPDDNIGIADSVERSSGVSAVIHLSPGAAVVQESVPELLPTV